MGMMKRCKIFILLYFLLIFISGCAASKQENPAAEALEETEQYPAETNAAAGETTQYPVETNNAVTEDIWEKGYRLPLEPSVKEEAEADCKRVMETIQNVYIEADKGDASNPILGEEVISQMCTILQETGCPVAAACFHYRMENYEKMDAFLRDCQNGKEGTQILYQMNKGGGINRSQFIYDGTEMYVIDTVSVWSEDNIPYVTASSYNRMRKWNYTEKGWFSYEYCVPEFPEVTEIVNGNYMLRVKPLPEEYIYITENYLLPVGYQGNNLFRSDWDGEHLEELDFNGLYEYLYSLKYQKAFGPQRNCDGIPKEEFESVITEYLPVTAEALARYAVFDEEKQQYTWKRLGPLTYMANNFSTSIPEVTQLKENPDGTISVYIDAVCEMRGDDALISHVLNLQIQEDGAVRYLSNQVLKKGPENIMEYQYRLPRVTIHGALHPAARHPASKIAVAGIQPLAVRRLFNGLDALQFAAVRP